MSYAYYISRVLNKIIGIILRMLSSIQDNEKTEESESENEIIFPYYHPICEQNEEEEIADPSTETKLILQSADLTMVSTACDQLVLTNANFSLAQCYQSM